MLIPYPHPRMRTVLLLPPEHGGQYCNCHLSMGDSSVYSHLSLGTVMHILTWVWGMNILLRTVSSHMSPAGALAPTRRAPLPCAGPDPCPLPSAAGWRPPPPPTPPPCALPPTEYAPDPPAILSSSDCAAPLLLDSPPAEMLSISRVRRSGSARGAPPEADRMWRAIGRAGLRK